MDEDEQLAATVALSLLETEATASPDPPSAATSAEREVGAVAMDSVPPSENVGNDAAVAHFLAFTATDDYGVARAALALAGGDVHLAVESFFRDSETIAGTAPVADDTMMGCSMGGQQLSTVDAYSLGLEDIPDDDFDFLGPLEGTPSPFSVGQAVTVLSDVAKVRELAEGHGGWEEWRMGPFCGRSGTVTKTDRDGDAEVTFEKLDGGTISFWYNHLALFALETQDSDGSEPEMPAPGPPRKLEQPTPPIEGRAVTFEFLQRLTRTRVTEEMKHEATEQALKYLSGCGETHIPHQCPGRHQLERFAAFAVTSATACDVCEQYLLEDSSGYKCDTCNYTQCELCWTQCREEDVKRRTEQQQRDFERRRRPPTFITGRDFHSKVIKADTHDLLCRYVELAGCGDGVDSDGSASVGDADCFVSWNWDSDWEQLLAALREHTEAVIDGGGQAPHYWIDLFAVNQHTALPPWKCQSGLGATCPGCAAVGDDMMSLEEMESGRRDKGFERVINSTSCRQTLLVLEPWFDPRPVTRVWCLYEMLLTIMAGKQLAFLSPPEERSKLFDALIDDITTVERSLVRVDTEHAAATMEDDRVRIFASIQLLLPGGFAELNARVSSELRRWTFAAGLQALDALEATDFRLSRMLNHLAMYFKTEGSAEHSCEGGGSLPLPNERPTLGDDSCTLCLAEWLRRESLRVKAAEPDYGVPVGFKFKSSVDEAEPEPELTIEHATTDDWTDTDQSESLFELEKILAFAASDDLELQSQVFGDDASLKTRFVLERVLGIDATAQPEPEPALESKSDPEPEPHVAPQAE